MRLATDPEKRPLASQIKYQPTKALYQPEGKVARVNEDTPTRIMGAAREILEENVRLEGVQLSLESVARRAGLTKPGLMYYFPTKQELLIGLINFAARGWHEKLCESAGSDPADINAIDRHRAYVEVSTRSEVSRADCWIFADALYHPVLAEHWQNWLEPWFSVAGENDEAAGALTAARFCADGAWLSEASGVMRAADLETIRKHALNLIDAAENLRSQM